MTPKEIEPASVYDVVMTFYDVCETAFGLTLLSFTSTLKDREIVEGGGHRLVASIIIITPKDFYQVRLLL